MYEKILDALNEMIDEIKKDQNEIEERRRMAIYCIKNSRNLTQLKLSIEMILIVFRRRMLLRDQIMFVQKIQKEVDKHLKRAAGR